LNSSHPCGAFSKGEGDQQLVETWEEGKTDRDKFCWGWRLNSFYLQLQLQHSWAGPAAGLPNNLQIEPSCCYLVQLCLVALTFALINSVFHLSKLFHQIHESHTCVFVRTYCKLHAHSCGPLCELRKLSREDSDHTSPARFCNANAPRSSQRLLDANYYSFRPTMIVLVEKIRILRSAFTVLVDQYNKKNIIPRLSLLSL